MTHFLQNARRMARAAYIRLLSLTGLLRWARTRVAKNGTVVLTLHRVLPDSQYESADSQRGMLVRESTFQALIEYLHQDCQCILLSDSASGSTCEDADPRPRVALTFDDGWKDNFKTALPVAQRHGVPFAVFICPAILSGSSRFWTTTVSALWQAAERVGKLDLVRGLAAGRVNGSVDSLIESLKCAGAKEREGLIAKLEAALSTSGATAPLGQDELLDWNDVRAMSAAGIQFGSHTSTHQILTQITPGEAMRELTESKSAIEAELKSCPWLAYPNGDWSEPVQELVTQSGYQRAFANSPGVWNQETNPFCIPRVNIWEGKLTGNNGRFSRAALEYAIFWAAYRGIGK